MQTGSDLLKGMELPQIDYSSFVSRVYWTVDLTGGSYDDVVTAVNGDKKIGSVTVTLSAADLGIQVNLIRKN